MENVREDKGADNADEAISLDLPAPPGWKKLNRKNPRSKHGVTFVSPSGEEISSRKQLEQFLKANPGGAVLSEFNWGTSETPRRSTRISEKTKAIPMVESTPKKKRSRTSSARKKINEGTPVVAEVPSGDVTENQNDDSNRKGEPTESAHEVTEKPEIPDIEECVEESANVTVEEEAVDDKLGIVIDGDDEREKMGDASKKESVIVEEVVVNGANVET